MPKVTGDGNEPPPDLPPEVDQWADQMCDLLGVNPQEVPEPNEPIEEAGIGDSWLKPPTSEAGDEDSWLNAPSSKPELDSWMYDTDPTNLVDGAQALQVDTSKLEKVGKRLGAGAYGEVFRIKEDGKDIAFKVAHTVEAQTALEKEAEIYEKIAAAGPHKNVIASQGMREVEGIKGLAMDYVEGCDASKLFSAAERFYKQNKISHTEYWGAIQNMLREALEGIQHIAKAGVSHSDIKSGNMLFDERTKTLKLCDFGRAAIIGEDPATIGTPALSAPEAIKTLPLEGVPGEDQRPRANAKQDTFAVGQMAYKSGEKSEHLYGARNPGDTHALTYMLCTKIEELEAAGRDKDYRALTPTDDPKQAGTAGHYGKGGKTAYVDFVNEATLMDIGTRGSAEDLLTSKFLSDPLLQPEEAQKVLSGLITRMKQEEDAEKAALNKSASKKP
ncbi:protein kinase domain-containing protein [Pseudovibrio denitrificans]|uniref:protein kinase domain-containing protein n=1 Tax=Pseudovibrio denitrificans TaxID=258256 RepID=UPI0039BF37A5